MKNKIFSVSSVKNLLKKEGAKAVSKGASKKMLELVETYARYISKKAIRNAFYSGRKTVKEEDLENN